MPIPRIVWQTYSSKKEELPDYLKAISSTWENSGLEYKYISDFEARKIIKENNDNFLIDVIDYASIPMVKADIIRAAIIYKYGGLYADIDTILKNPITSWIDFNKDFFLIERPEDHSFIKNDLFAFSEKHPIMESILEEILNRCHKAMKNNEMILPYHTGPEVYEHVIKKNNIDILRSNGLKPANFQSNYIHINGLTLKDNVDFNRSIPNKNAFDFLCLNELYKNFDMTKADIKIYINKSGYGS